METVYFAKELPNQPFYLTTGAPFKFDYMATEDAWMIQELNAAIQNGIGGVYKITKAQYDDAIKKKNGEKSPNNSAQYRQELQSANLSNPQARALRAGHVAVVAGRQGLPQAQTELPDPLKVPDPSQFKMPSVGKAP